MARDPYPLGGNGGIMSDMASKPLEGFRRLKTQTLSIGMQYIVDGIGFTLNWVELDIAVSGRRFAVFNVPAGYYLAIDYRLIDTSAEKVWYHVYPEGTYTLGAAKTNDATGFLKYRNLRQDSTFSPANLAQRYNVTSAPTRIDDSFVDEVVFGTAGSGSGNKSYGNLEPESTFFLLNPDQQFLLEFFNGGAGTASAQVQLNFALIPVSEVSPVVI